MKDDVICVQSFLNAWVEDAYDQFLCCPGDCAGGGERQSVLLLFLDLTVVTKGQTTTHHCVQYHTPGEIDSE